MWSIKACAPLLAAAASAALLTACASGGKPEVADARTPLEQYTVKVVETPERVALAVHAQGLSDKQEAALVAFAQRWHESGAEGITVEVPVNSPEKSDPRLSAQAVTAALSRMGVPADRMRLVDVDAGGAADAPIVARYGRLQAVGPDCGGHWSNVASTGSNAVTSHFGCAVTANFAAQLADARDLTRPAPTEPADGLRRATVLDKYRQGLTTSSQKDDQASGAVSTAVRN
jgi:pilus assembly protein CpaD